MLTWKDPLEITVPAELQAAVGGHRLITQTLARRGILSAEAARAFIDPTRYTPAPAEDLPGLEIACQRIEAALARSERIWVWGDFDVDGQTSTSLLVQTLRMLGAAPNYHIPVRANESHGVNIPHLEHILEQGADLMLTCDTGITAHESLTYAQSRGLDVIVTDHHALGETLPPALACINPRLLPPHHPLGGLPGVGVAYKLAEALLRRAGRPQDAARLLDLAALGIVADVALQTGDTRYLLQRGLGVLRAAERPGIKAMLTLAEVNPANLTEEHIGFLLGPRMNALGRLDDANPAVELLTTSDPDRARALALQLEGLNARRQLLTAQVLQGALTQIERDPALLDSPVLILAHPEWPAGVVGIVASQLTERYNRPTLLISSPPNEAARGSARSVEGIDITAAIAANSALLLGFGGHPMAAGLALNPDSLPALRRGLARAVQQSLDASGGPQEACLQLDGFLPLGDLNLAMVADLERLAPFGAGNPSLTLAARGLTLLSSTPIGRQNEHLQMLVQDDSGADQKVLWWGGAGWPQPQGRFDLAYHLRASTYRGQREVQVEWVDFRPAPEDIIQVRSSQLDILDYRNLPQQRALLDALRAEGETTVWCEGPVQELLNGQDRTSLSPACTLAVWTTPPSRAVLQAALAQVRPQRVAIFAISPDANTPEEFLPRLAGLIKFALAHPNLSQPLSLARLAGLTAQRETTLRLGLDWLAANGQVQYSLKADVLTLSSGSGQPANHSTVLLNQIKDLLAETAAYRRYFSSADKTALGLDKISLPPV